ncbi:MAG: YicC/YloC family endoribonuclease [Planctomycetota bacterium]
MLRSMTGFGGAAGEVAGRSIRVEIRSVNHRHLQVKTRVPGELAGMESEVEGRLKKKLKRGSVTVSVVASRPIEAAVGSIDVEAAERYHATLNQLARRVGEGEVPLSAVLSLPGVVAQEADGAALEEHAAAVLKLVDRAAAALVEMRKAEGAALERDLRKHAGEIDKLVERIDKRMPRVVREHQKNLARRVEDLLGGATPVEPQDLARELALLADKLDVSEELSRLRSHMQQLGAFLDKGGDLGRKLDFLVQEIFREANTIGSKCNDAKVAHLVVDMKTRVERLREQVQNVE